ncbi:MAG TPA: hypothetical protein VM487_21620, partial [Phycisphaerae bacterium]|nr:hypothetical protein [Phycisphaerae bacterium]
MPYVCTIAGTVVEPEQYTLKLSDTANGRDTFLCDILSEDGSYRPALDAEVILVEGVGGTSATSVTIGVGEKTFTTQAGLWLVASTRVRVYRASDPTAWMQGAITSYVGTALVVDVDETNGSGTATDWIIARRIFGGTITKPAESGFHGAPLVPITTRVEATDFNALADRRTYRGTIPAGNLKAALEVLVAFLDDVVLDPNQVMGPSLPELSFDDEFLVSIFDMLTTLTGGYPWEIDYWRRLRMFDPTTTPAPFDIAAGDDQVCGDVTVEPNRENYANRIILRAGSDEFPIRVVANDVPEQAPPRGIWEQVINAPNIFEEVTAQLVADAYVGQSVQVPKVVHYPTRQGGGLAPGQVQTIVLPIRDLSGSFLVTQVNTQDDGSPDLLRDVTVIEGAAFQRGQNWRDTYKQWSAGGGSGTGSVVVGAAGATKTVYFLGGSALEYVQSPTPTWVPASAMRIAIDTVQRGTTSATVTVRLRTAAGGGVSVTARLQNVEDNVTVGTSAPVASAGWVTVTFAVTLTAGTRTYELQLQ